MEPFLKMQTLYDFAPATGSHVRVTDLSPGTAVRLEGVAGLVSTALSHIVEQTCDNTRCSAVNIDVFLDRSVLENTNLIAFSAAYIVP